MSRNHIALTAVPANLTLRAEPGCGSSGPPGWRLAKVPAVSARAPVLPPRPPPTRSSVPKFGHSKSSAHRASAALLGHRARVCARLRGAQTGGYHGAYARSPDVEPD